MPIISIDVTDGPNIQASGQHRGQVTAIFDDGRSVVRNIRAPDATAWANVVVDMQAEIQAKQEQQDAEDGIGPDVEVTANLEASIEQRAVAYLREAWGTEQAYDGFLLFDKFNDFRLAKGWTLAQVAANLLAAGLEQSEWDEMETAYTYLSGASRPATMASALTIQGNWESR